MFKKNIHFAVFYTILLALTLFACMRGSDFGKQDPITFTESFEITADDGTCYMITLIRMPDNSVKFIKEQVACTKGFESRRGIYESQLALSGTLNLPDGTKTWFIPLYEGQDTIQMIGDGIRCYCEEQDVYDCNGNGECYYGGFIFKKCYTEPCCTDCDAEICDDSHPAPIPIKQSGIVVKGSNLIIDLVDTSLKSKERNDNTYYGNNVSIEINRSGNMVIATRTLLSQGITYSVELHNLTDLLPVGKTLNFTSGKNYWLIPFVPGGTTLRVNSTPPCCVDDGCTGECEMTRNANGCLGCSCTANGDCDLEPAYASGGILVEADSLQVIDNQ